MSPIARITALFCCLLLLTAFVTPQNMNRPRGSLLLVQGDPSGIKGDMAFRITEVKPGSLASRAGLRINDLIIAVDDRPVLSLDQLEKTILQPALRPGIRYSISFVRFDPATGRFEVGKKHLDAE